MDHLFLHCPTTLLYDIGHLDLLGLLGSTQESGGVVETITYQGLGDLPIGKSLWCITSPTLLWTIWWEMNVEIF